MVGLVLLDGFVVIGISVGRVGVVTGVDVPITDGEERLLIVIVVIVVIVVVGVVTIVVSPSSRFRDPLPSRRSLSPLRRFFFLTGLACR